MEKYKYGKVCYLWMHKIQMSLGRQFQSLTTTLEIKHGH